MTAELTPRPGGHQPDGHHADAEPATMTCPRCSFGDVQYVIDAYVVYSAVSEDGTTTVGAPYVQTFDNTFLECRDCGWKDENVEVKLGDRRLEDEIT
jgi:hypothetical protein